MCLQILLKIVSEKEYNIVEQQSLKLPRSFLKSSLPRIFSGPDTHTKPNILRYSIPKPKQNPRLSDIS